MNANIGFALFFLIAELSQVMKYCLNLEKDEDTRKAYLVEDEGKVHYTMSSCVLLKLHGV